MGYITNQFVNKGMGVRSRTYKLVKVKVDAKPVKRSAILTLRRLGESVELRARQESGEYQDVKLTDSEAADVALAAIAGCEVALRIEIAKAALATLTNDELVGVLAADTGRRNVSKVRRGA